MARQFQPTQPASANGTSDEAADLLQPDRVIVDPLEDSPDPFDPSSLRLPEDYGAAIGVKKALLSVAVRRPSREWFIQANQNPEFHLRTHLLELKELGETYLVAPHLWDELAGESTFTPRLLLLSVNRQHVPFLWPIRLPDVDGRVDSWSRSAFDAATMGMGRWIRVVANRAASSYDVFYSDHAADPVWPQLSMAAILRLAFKDYYIESRTHAVLRQLRGEV